MVALVVALIAVGTVRACTAETPGMAAMHRTGLAGYTPPGTERTGYSESEAHTDLKGARHPDQIDWSLRPTGRLTTADIVKALDRAAANAGFDQARWPLAFAPPNGIGDERWHFAREGTIGGVAVGIGASEAGDHVDVSMYLVADLP